MYYKFTEKTIFFNDRVLRQIEAIKDLPCGVKKGDIGGYIESENKENRD